MPYEVYKLIHIVSILLFAGALGTLFLGNKEHKGQKIVLGIVSLTILVGGMGLLARLNFSHGEPWPMWVKVKIVFWLPAAMLAPILNKRVSQSRTLAYWLIMAILFGAAYIAIFKPFV